MEQILSWEANSRSASEILRHLWDPKIIVLLHKSPPLNPVLSQLNPVYTRSSLFIYMCV